MLKTYEMLPVFRNDLCSITKVELGTGKLQITVSISILGTPEGSKRFLSRPSHMPQHYRVGLKRQGVHCGSFPLVAQALIGARRAVRNKESLPAQSYQE